MVAPRHGFGLVLLAAVLFPSASSNRIALSRQCSDRERDPRGCGSGSRRKAVLLRGGGGGGGGEGDALTDAKAKLSGWWKARTENMSMPAKVDPDLPKAQSLMKKRGLASCEKAVGLLRSAHKRDPENVEVSLALADALNAVMRIKSNANALVLEGSQDTAANKRLWKTLGDEALPLAKAAYSSKPGDVKALAVYADAFMFSCSAKGIVKQALSGTAKEYKRVANELRKYPKWDGAVGLVFLGGFYNVAPWPVGNKGLARKFLSEACSISASRRNLYYVGVNAYQTGDYERAVVHFQKALKAPCGSETEADFGEWMLEQSRDGLARAKTALAEAKVEQTPS